MEEDRLKQLVAKVAREELREDENNRTQSLEQLRDWIRKNPDIRRCRIDDKFLLSFLRTKKFNVPMAEEQLMRFIRFRQNFKDIMNDLDIKNPAIEDVISSGYNFVSPVRDDHGRQILFFFTKNFNAEKYDWKVLTKVFQMNLHYLIEDEISQVVGVVYIIDMADCAQLYGLFPLKVFYDIMTMAEKALPIRLKEIYFINVPSVAVWIFKIITSLMSEKIQQRNKMVSSLEDLHQYVDKNVLPKELGGKLPASEMIDQWKKVLLSQRDSVMSSNSMQLAGDSVDRNQQGGELQGSFKTLNID